ncbi:MULTISPECIES: GMC family oxidoreductase [Actinomadura]|uniref:GMC family oxidoreductase n=1 Tax=Actinomadura yumaensis TaxID=111807 RepID=A0ABW2CBN0_9ACTN|nr:GMC family oxidoreductase [Actinomadura sp. J1-007]MWK38199.1 FAD-binding protein [Actinomadura sp. J1-007]
MNDVFAPGTPKVITEPPDDLECDIVIVGSGMGGGTLAYALRDSGARVLIVEQGGFLPREAANWSPTAVHVQGRYKNSPEWYDDKGKAFVPGNYHYVGGSTKMYGATLPRLREHDFGAVEHPDGVSPAWPLSYADLEPHYAEAERMFLVHGRRGDDPTDPWRSTDFPFPPLPHVPAMADFAASARAQGLRPFALPQAVDVRDGGACVLCPTCDAFPCLVDAKGDADVRAVRPAIASPTVRLLTNAEVRRLDTGPGGRRVTGAEIVHGGRTITVRAGRFVVSAGAANTAALLLRSASDAHPSGLSNASGQVGRNFMRHITSFFVAVDPRRVNGEGFHKTLGINDWYAAGPTTRHPLGNVQGLGKLGGPHVKNARRHIPLPILDAVTHRTLDLFLQTEDLPLRDNRVRLDAKGNIVLSYRPTNRSAHRELVARMKRVARRAGYPVVLHQELGIEATSHQCGTARMGADGASSVVDPFCRSHDVENLWVVDSSPFPSSAAVNPALTVAALALRVAAAGDLTS